MQWKCIGVIANTAEGAALCYRELVHQASLFVRDHSHPEIILHQFSFIDYKTALERVNSGDPEFLKNLLTQAALKLKGAGADFVIIPANSSHLIFDSFAKDSPLPAYSIVEATLAECRKKAYTKPLFLGTYWSMKHRLYSSASSSENGVECIYPIDEDQRIIHSIIMDELIQSKVEESSRERIYRMVKKYQEDFQVDSVILGCTELPLVFDRESPLPCVDSTLALALGALEAAFNN